MILARIRRTLKRQAAIRRLAAFGNTGRRLVPLAVLFGTTVVSSVAPSQVPGGQVVSNSALVLPSTPTHSNALPPDADIRDIAPPIALPNHWKWLWWSLAVAALLALLRFALRRRQQRAVPLPPPVPAHVRAKERLRQALTLISDPRVFCGEVSDALRVYLEERFEFRAPERTTEEFLRELKGTDLLLPDQKLSLADFLHQCDLVKFARHEPPEEELRALRESALRLIDETQFDPVKPAEAATPGDA